MISPVAKQVSIKKTSLPDVAIQAGYSALSKQSILMDSDTTTYAVSRDILKEIEKHTEILLKDLFYGANHVNLQVWKYNPIVFAAEGSVDKLSLYLSLCDDEDERTQSILQELKESVLNG